MSPALAANRQRRIRLALLSRNLQQPEQPLPDMRQTETRQRPHTMRNTPFQAWTVLTAGIILQTAIGGIYAWSTFVPVLVEEHGFTRAQTGLLFGVQVLGFSLTTIPAGRLLERFGPRPTASAGALLFGAGYLIASLAGDSYPAMLVALGLVTGSGIGLVYVCPLTTGMKWFPRQRGLVTGAAVAGFGLGAVFLSQAAEYLLVVEGLSVHEVFRVVGFVFGGTAFAAALFLAVPEEIPGSKVSAAQERWAALLASPAFLVIAFGMFAGTFAGLLVSAHLKPFLLHNGAPESLAVLAISLFAVGNASGRLAWGFVHDRIGSRLTILISLAALLLTLLALVATAMAGSPTAVPALIVLIGFGFGGCFVIYVSAISTLFGVDLVARLYPFCFICYGLAALVGPAAGGWLVDNFDSYTPALLLCAAFICAAIIAVWVSDIRRWEVPH